MNKFFAKLEKVVDELNVSNSKNEKVETLAKYKNDKDIKNIMRLVYDKNITFGVKSSNIKKFRKNKNYDEVKVKEYKSIFDLLKDLYKRNLSGYEALKAVNEFVGDNDDYEDLILKIIDKSLKIAMGTPNINKALGKNTIPTFKPALANKFTEKVFLKYSDNKWGISRKLDGVRCLLYVDKVEGDMLMLSRQGKPLGKFMSVLDDLKGKIKNVPHDKFYLDGELVYYEDGKTENFQAMIKQIKRGDNPPVNTNQNVKYLVFDILTNKDFESETSETTYQERHDLLDKVFGVKGKTAAEKRKNLKNKSILVLKQFPYTKKEFERLSKISAKKNWEGLMLRKMDVIYKGGRSNDILKVKKFFDEEYKVLGITRSEMPVLNHKTGKNKITPVMGAIIIDYHETQVGSGFSIQERIKYLKNPNLIVGKMVTVKYFEKSQNEKGVPSLRFPTFLAIRDYE